MSPINLLVLADALLGVQADAHHNGKCCILLGIFLQCLIGQYIEDESRLDGRNAFFGIGEHLLISYKQGLALLPNDP